MFTLTGDEFCLTNPDFSPDNDQEVTTGAWQRRARYLTRECLDCPVFTQCWEELNRLFEEKLTPPAGVMAGAVIALHGKPHAKFIDELRRTYAFAIRHSGVSPSDVFDRYLDVELMELKRQKFPQKQQTRD